MKKELEFKLEELRKLSKKIGQEILYCETSNRFSFGINGEENKYFDFQIENSQLEVRRTTGFLYIENTNIDDYIEEVQKINIFVKEINHQLKSIVKLLEE